MPKVLAFDNKNEKSCFFILYCAHLIVPLATPKVLTFDNKNEKSCFFILYCAHLIVPLQFQIRNRTSRKTKGI